MVKKLAGWLHPEWPLDPRPESAAAGKKCKAKNAAEGPQEPCFRSMNIDHTSSRSKQLSGNQGGGGGGGGSGGLCGLVAIAAVC